MLHGSETWPVRKENEVALQRAAMIMVRWMCDVKVTDRVPSKELRERLGMDDVILVLQQNRLRNGCRNIWSMKWRAADQEDQRGRGERLCKEIAKHVN